MKNLLFYAIIITSSNIIYSQTNFEGAIIYSNTFKSKMVNLSTEQLAKMIGTRQEYYIREGTYKSITNGQSIIMQLYHSETNRLYNQTAASDTLYWFDASTNTDNVLSYDLKKEAEVILGYPCDALIVKTRTGTTTFYFSSQLTLDKARYKNHNYGNWSFFVEKSSSLPLRIITDNSQFFIESTAIEVKPMKLDEQYFKINDKIPIKKSQ